VDLIYVGQLEQRLHPDTVDMLATMAAQGELTSVYHNERVIIYAVPGRLQQDADGSYRPAAG
jgi:hypothetical protein